MLFAERIETLYQLLHRRPKAELEHVLPQLADVLCELLDGGTVEKVLGRVPELDPVAVFGDDLEVEVDVAAPQ